MNDVLQTIVLFFVASVGWLFTSQHGSASVYQTVCGEFWIWVGCKLWFNDRYSFGCLSPHQTFRHGPSCSNQMHKVPFGVRHSARLMVPVSDDTQGWGITHTRLSTRVHMLFVTSHHQFLTGANYARYSLHGWLSATKLHQTSVKFAA